MDDRLAGWEKACAAGLSAEVIRGVLAVAASEQFAIVLYTPQLGPTGDRTPLELFEVNQVDGAIVDGILITDPEARRLERSELPVVSLDFRGRRRSTLIRPVLKPGTAQSGQQHPKHQL